MTLPKGTIATESPIFCPFLNKNVKILWRWHLHKITCDQCSFQRDNIPLINLDHPLDLFSSLLDYPDLVVPNAWCFWKLVNFCLSCSALPFNFKVILLTKSHSCPKVPVLSESKVVFLLLQSHIQTHLGWASLLHLLII